MSIKHPFFEELLKIDLPVGSYAIFGSGPLFARGLTDDIPDLDVIVTAAGWQKALSAGELGRADDGDPVIRVGNHIEVFNGWAPGVWNVDRLIKDAENIDGIPFLRLEDVLAWKKIRNKPKDRTHIALIEEYLLKGANRQ